MTREIATLSLAVITIVITAISVYTDIRWGKIFNAFTLPALGLGLVINGVARGTGGLWLSGEGLLLGFGLFVVSAVFGRLLGGGDVKLLMAIGALQGPHFLMFTLLYMALTGAALAIAVGLYHGILGQRLRALAASCYLRAAQGVPMEMNETGGGPRLPYAIAIGVGSLTTLVLTRGW